MPRSGAVARSLRLTRPRPALHTARVPPWTPPSPLTGAHGTTPGVNPAAGTVVTVDSPWTPDAAPPREGLALPPRYEDRGMLGEGAIGQVRRVYDRTLQATLAMKILQRSPSAEARARFWAEARVTARLNHPGVVAVQDLGELPDGRPWFTMEEVHGQTFGEVIRARVGGLRRLLDLYVRACEAVAYAHAEGVVHRDLKPDNIMVGAFGEVRVMDWGLARVLHQVGAYPAPPSEGGPSIGMYDREGDAAPPLGDRAPPYGDGTALGSILGTPGYMPPEQAVGRSREVGPEADVYALGAILYTVLSGTRPYAGRSGLQALEATRQGPPAPITTLAPDAPGPLIDLCTRAMARDAKDRPANAGDLAASVRDWLEGARKEAEARVLLEAALARQPEVERLLDRANHAEAEAAARLEDVPPFAPVEDKLPAWRLEAEAEATRAEALRVEEELQRGVRAALAQAPELREAHEALADLYRARLLRAEALGESLAAADAEARLREHDRGRHAAWLRGDGAVTLLTDPPGATVSLYRLVERDRRLVEVHERILGTTPLVEVPIPRGSSVLLIEHPDRVTVRYPVYVGRLEHWDGVRPGSSGLSPIHLPAQLGPDECYVPAGWFRSGGDKDALDGLPARRFWVDGLIVARSPVTNEAYRTYLAALLQDGVDIEAAVPRSLTGEAVLFRRVGAEVHLGMSEDGPLRPREPVVYVTPEQGDAYVRWRAAQDGLPWRLPHDQEWEKAARGVDGRIYPWGHRFEPTWTRMQSSLPGAPGRADVDEIPGDVGPYGVVGMAGNVRDLCINGYRRAGTPGDGEVVVPEPAAAGEPFRMLRGGSWTSAERQCRLATRVTTRPGVGLSVSGLRLFRTFTAG